MSLDDKVDNVLKGIERLDGKMDRVIYTQGFHAADIENLKKKVFKKREKINWTKIFNMAGSFAEFMAALHPVVQIVGGILTFTGIAGLLIKVIR